jgi:hypothetical protein
MSPPVRTGAQVAEVAVTSASQRMTHRHMMRRWAEAGEGSLRGAGREPWSWSLSSTLVPEDTELETATYQGQEYSTNTAGLGEVFILNHLWPFYSLPFHPHQTW